MKRKQDRPDETLRKKAEQVLAEESNPVVRVKPADKGRMLRELQVHRIELEMQNEELRRAQLEIQESRSRYADLYDFAPVGYFTFDRNGLIKEVNLTGAEMLGVNRNQLIDRPFSIFLARDERDAFRKHYCQVLREGGKHRCELALQKGPDVNLGVDVESVLGRSADGEGSVRSAIIDISEQKRVESKLREANAKLKKAVLEQKRTTDALARLDAAIGQTHEAVMVTDQNWNIEYANRAASALTGYDKGELIGMNAWTLRDPAGGNPLRGQPPTDIGECGVCSGRFAVRRKDGTFVEVEGDSTPVESTGGAMHNCVLVLHDVTERIKLERQLRQAQKMEAVGTFAAGIAHDFNNILAGIVGFTEMVIEDTDPEDPRYGKLSLVLKGANRGRNLTHQILAFGRSVEPSRTAFSLGEVISEVNKLIRPSVPSTIDIKVNITAKTGVILGDQTQIQQVLVNLVSNAAYAMREKGGSLEITVADVMEGSKDYERLRAIRPEMWLELAVLDTGSGMTPDVIERIFDPFFTTKGPGEGSGMGLSVVHGIVRDHGGDIVVESKPGEGSTFHLFLPSILPAVRDLRGNKETAIPAGKASILFVDDEQMLVEMNKARLGRLGYNVTATTSSAEALKLFQSNPNGFDLLITDYTMPHLTGIDLAREVLSVRKGFPIILCTGVGEEKVVRAARAAGIGGFLSKPIAVREIASLIAELLAPKATTSQARISAAEKA